MNVVVQNLLTHYELQGEGQTILLLHGWGDNLKGLAGLQKQLQSQYQVVSLDLPGFGATQASAGVWDLDSYSHFVAAFLAKLQLKPYAVVGHSNGGALAIRAISIGKLKPMKLVLLAASGIRSGRSVKLMALRAVAKGGKVATAWLPKTTKRKLRSKLYQSAGSDYLVMEHLQETFKKTVRQDVQADAAILTLPSLLIFGDQDAAVPIKDGHTYNRIIKGSQLQVIEGAGHFVHLDEPERVANLIKEFLS